jgi:hypothetical protein
VTKPGSPLISAKKRESGGIWAGTFLKKAHAVGWSAHIFTTSGRGISLF